MAKKAAKKVIAKSGSETKRSKIATKKTTGTPKKSTEIKSAKRPSTQGTVRKASLKKDATSKVSIESDPPSKTSVRKRTTTKSLAETTSTGTIESTSDLQTQTMEAPKKRASRTKVKPDSAVESTPTSTATLLVQENLKGQGPTEETISKPVRQDVKVGINGPNPMYIVEYLMFVKGHYWYGTSSCDGPDSLSGILVSTVPKANAPRNKLGDELRRRVYVSPKAVHIDIDPATEPGGLFESDGKVCKTNCDGADVFPFADRVHRILEKSVLISDPVGIEGRFRILSMKLHDGSEAILAHPVNEPTLVQGSLKKIRTSKVLKPGSDVTANIYVVDIECKGENQAKKNYRVVRLLNSK